MLSRWSDAKTADTRKKTSYSADTGVKGHIDGAIGSALMGRREKRVAGIQNYSAAWQEPVCGASIVWVLLGQASQTWGWGSLALHTSCDPLGIMSTHSHLGSITLGCLIHL
jgi:hypothetical protein